MTQRNAQNPTAKPIKDRVGYYRVDSETYRRVVALAELEGRTASDVVRRAIKEFMESRDFLTRQSIS